MIKSIDYQENHAVVTTISDMTKKEIVTEMPITKSQVRKWHVEGLNIQDAMPNLSATNRELLLTGITDKEWDKVFPEEDE